MAQFISERYELPTVRITARPTRSGTRVRLQYFAGDRELDAQDEFAGAFGLVEDLSVKAYRERELRLPDQIARGLQVAMHPVLNPGEPLWLIVESSGLLAVVPWEQLIEPLFNIPVLRVPNFVADPAFLAGPLRLALCLSSAFAKTPFDVVAYARALVKAVQSAVTAGTQLHVFAEADVYPSLTQVIPASDGPHSVTIHHPESAARFGPGETDRSLGQEPTSLRSPWLLWMQDRIEGAIDGVHFVCPGYFQADRGALALARSPLPNPDENAAHFVGAGEIAAFLQLVGAWCVMFSPPYENVWSIGPRVVASALAWQRPGPVLLHDLRLGHSGEQELEGAYRFLFDERYAPPPASPYLMMYVHPKRLAQYEGVDQFESPGERPLPADLEYAVKPLIHRARRGAHDGRGSRQPSWKQVADVQMGKLMLKLKDSDSATSRGIADALTQITSILRNGDDS